LLLAYNYPIIKLSGQIVRLSTKGEVMNRYVTAGFLSLLSASAFAAAPAASAPAKAAAAPKFAIMNSSPDTLIDSAAANAVWNATLTAKVAKLHPVKKVGYISEVNGGFDTSKTCVVVVRAMTVPLKGKSFIYAPKNTSVAFGSQAGATPEQCSALAKAKLTEAVQSINLSLENG
jgi:hypothetical protein